MARGTGVMVDRWRFARKRAGLDHHSKGIMEVSLFFFGWNLSESLKKIIIPTFLLKKTFSRWLAGVSAIPILVVLLIYPYIPESPRQLVLEGRNVSHSMENFLVLFFFFLHLFRGR